MTTVRDLLLATALGALCACAPATSRPGASGGGPPAPPGSIDPGAFLSAERATTWEPGLLATGGIPARATSCANLAPSGGDDTAAINAAIAACPAGQVVRLGAGTFAIDDDFILLDRGVTLRGAGPGATTLRRSNGATDCGGGGAAMPIVVVGPSRWKSAGTAHDLAADAPKGATTIRLASAPAGGFGAGDVVLVDEASGAGWRPDPAGRGEIWASADFRVVWQKHRPALPTDDFADADYPTTPGSAGEWFSRLDRPIAEVKEVAAWDGASRTLTFSTPLHASFRTAGAAQLFAYAPVDRHVRGAGVEDLRLQGGDDGQLRFTRAAYSWSARLEHTGWLGEGIAIDDSFRVEVRDSFVHTPVCMTPGGGSYNISLSSGTAEVLIENNISVDADKVMVARASGAGSVVGYNHMDDGHIDYAPDWVEIGLNASHMVGPHHVLFEGNYGFNWDSDKTHGNSTYHTVFRNHLSGRRQGWPAGGPNRCAGAGYYSTFMSFVGNVLGLPGQMGGWVYEATGAGDDAVWLLGWDDWAPYPMDPQVRATALRHGNFDYLTGAVAWDPAIAARELPASLYRRTRPPFFDAGRGYTWPWVEPGGPERLFSLPAKARYDAGTPFAQP